MASLLQQIQEQIVVPAVMGIIADEVLRTDAEGNQIPVTAFFNELPPTRDTTVGERIVRHATLQLDHRIEVAPGDKWTVGTEEWGVHPRESIGNVDGAFRVLTLRRDDKISTRKRSNTLL